MRPLALVPLALGTLAPVALPAQRPDSLATDVRQYVVVDTVVVALSHVLLVDGTGAAPKPDQTIVIRDGRIAEVGPAPSGQVPAGAQTMDLSGSTVIPGLVGMHDHLFYTAAGGRAVQMSYTGPRLYLGSGPLPRAARSQRRSPGRRALPADPRLRAGGRLAAGHLRDLALRRMGRRAQRARPRRSLRLHLRRRCRRPCRQQLHADRRAPSGACGPRRHETPARARKPPSRPPPRSQPAGSDRRPVLSRLPARDGLRPHAAHRRPGGRLPAARQLAGGLFRRRCGPHVLALRESGPEWTPAEHRPLAPGRPGATGDDRGGWAAGGVRLGDGAGLRPPSAQLHDPQPDLGPGRALLPHWAAARAVRGRAGSDDQACGGAP